MMETDRATLIPTLHYAPSAIFALSKVHAKRA